MGLNLKELQRFTITDLSGGVNEFASTYKVGDNELITAKNMSFKDSGGIRVRMGDETKDYGNVSGIESGIASMYRYASSLGARFTLMYTIDGYIWIDFAGPFNFVRVPTAAAQQILSNDGKCRFDQYLDTVIFGTDRDGMYLYNPNESLITLGKFRIPSSFAATGIAFVNYLTVLTVGGFFSNTGTSSIYYYYLYTLDYGHGDFIGESSPVYTPSTNAVKYNAYRAEIPAGTTTNMVQFKKNESTMYDVPSEITRINVYRGHMSPSINNNTRTERLEYFYVGSIDRSDWDNASNGDVVFEDLGAAQGSLIEYNKMEIPPSGKFIKMHKGRIWIANVRYADGSVEAWANSAANNEDYNSYPHRVFISSINSNGNFEPAGFYADQFKDIEPKGSGITGIWSYQNHALVVFKANSMWAIIGDDPHPETGNIRVRNISNNIGCIAPDSICEVEGRLTWLSNSGVYYWDGGSKPAPLKTDNIVDTVQGMTPFQKKNIASVYDRKQRELIMSFADDSTSGYNRKVAKFDVRTSAWSIDEYFIGLSAFVNVDEPEEGSKVYAGLSDMYSFRAIYGTIEQLNTGNSTLYSYIGTPTDGKWDGIDINFSFQTKFYDGGTPFMNKNFVAVMFELDTNAQLTLDVKCDSRLDTTAVGEDSFPIDPPSYTSLVWATIPGPGGANNLKWYEDPNYLNVWADQKPGSRVVYLDSRCWGKRISLTISGLVKYPVAIDSITVFYKPKEGVRSD